MGGLRQEPMFLVEIRTGLLSREGAFLDEVLEDAEEEDE
jgi:hypothetical protein